MTISSSLPNSLSNPMKLKSNSIWHAYWQLFLALAMPVLWARWLIFIGISLLALGGAFYYLLNLSIAESHSLLTLLPTLTMILGGALCAVFPIMVIFLLPSQMLTVASSKHFSLLVNIRAYSALVLGIYLAIHCLLLALITMKSQRLPLEIIENFILFFTLASVIMLATIYITHRIAMAQFLVGLIFIAVAPLFNFFKSLGVFYQLILTLTVWIAFLFWWLNWRPQKYHRSLFIESMSSPSQAQQMQLNLWFMQFTISKSAKSWFGSRFLARSDSLINSFYTSFIGFSVGVAILALTFFVIMPKVAHKDPNAFFQINGVMIFVYAMITAYGFSAQLATAQLTNFKKTWLYFMGSRTQLFRNVENLCAKQYLVQLSAVVVPVSLFLIFFPMLRSIAQPIFWGLGLGILHSLFHIYLNLWMYKKFRAQRNWIIGINIVGTLVTYVPCAVLGAFPDFVTAYWEFFTVLFAIYLGVIVLLRRIAQSSWAHIEFYEAR